MSPLLHDCLLKILVDFSYKFDFVLLSFFVFRLQTTEYNVLLFQTAGTENFPCFMIKNHIKNNESTQWAIYVWRIIMNFQQQ